MSEQRSPLRAGAIVLATAKTEKVDEDGSELIPAAFDIDPAGYVIQTLARGDAGIAAREDGSLPLGQHAFAIPAMSANMIARALERSER